MSSVDDVDKSLWKEHLFIVHDLTGACRVGGLLVPMQTQRGRRGRLRTDVCTHVFRPAFHVPCCSLSTKHGEYWG